MSFTQHELNLRRIALERIRQGMLPAEVSKKIWAGPGSGQSCSVCDGVIGSAEMEYEINARMADGTERVVPFHLRCHALWQLEVARLAEN